MNAPKKIWVDEPDVFCKSYSNDEILYIRADIVEEMREAVKKMVDGDFGSDGWSLELDRAANQMRSALKRLEEE